MKAPALKDKQFVTDAQGNRVGVLLDLKTYGRLCEAEEELADIRAYDAALPQIQADLKAGRFSTLAEYRNKRGQGSMMHRVILPKSVQKELDRLPDDIVTRILARLEELEMNPRPTDAKKLKGHMPGASERVITE